MKAILAIGGSDSAGCSGIQADLKTMSAFDLHGSSVVTTITAQNTREVRENIPMSAEIVRAQLELILSDLTIGAVKTGLLGTSEIIHTIADVLRTKAFNKMPIIVDPVIRASTGKVLLGEDAQSALIKQILPLTTLLTPNAIEASALTGIPIHCAQDAINAGRSLIDLGCESVLIKGGHFNFSPGTDILVLPNQVLTFTGKAIEASNTRGTGCTLASAIAACLTKGMPLPESVQIAKAFVQRSIESSYSIGEGPGPIDVFHCQRYAKIHRAPLGRFHAITNASLQSTYSHIELANLALKGGADVVQYREKSNLDSMSRITIATQIRSLCHEYKANLIVNDRTEIARGACAAGVHIGKNDLPPKLARQIMGPIALIGRTANSFEEALQAEQEPVDYIGVGPVFGTTSKVNAAEPLGLETLEKIANHTTKPIIAIGGIDPEHVDALIKAGAFGFAILSGLWKYPSPLENIRLYSEKLRSAVFKYREVL